MPGPHPSTAAVRTAVRAALVDVAPAALVLAACSGGADSLALAEGLAFAARRERRRAGAIVVDHGLQPDSGVVAETAATTCRVLGLDPVLVRRVRVRRSGDGLEADARTARYAALEKAAEESGAAIVLLGHTLDDQAEQVLLGLVRGSGARSLSGMPRARGRYRRPLLEVTRAQTRMSCAAEGLAWWEDPMNEDPAVLRVRVRRALADLERDLGPGIASALARSAAQLREDADHLDRLADAALSSVLAGADPGSVLAGVGPPLVLAVDALLLLPRPVRTRVWRRALILAGAPAGQVSTRHTEACDALIARWHGQGPADVPGALRVTRTGTSISIGPAGQDARLDPPGPTSPGVRHPDPVPPGPTPAEEPATGGRQPAVRRP